MTHAIVLNSGGLDSATVMAMVKTQGYRIHALSFDYGQRHACEIESAKQLAATYEAEEHAIINLRDIGRLGGSSLTDHTQPIPTDQAKEVSIPSTYVPARNTLFLSIAMGWAEIRRIQDIFVGFNAIDYSGYPDCRPAYLEAFQALANVATKAAIHGAPPLIHAPLMHLTKAEIITQGSALGVNYASTVSCYQATDNGKACAQCDACTLRRQGFLAANVPDPTRYA